MHEETFGDKLGNKLGKTSDVAHAALGQLLHRAARMMMRGAGHHHGPHHGQMRILRMLGQHEVITQRELMDALQVRSSSLSELLIKLEARGAITRSRDEEDRRGMLIRLTPQGREMINAHECERSALSAQLFTALSEQEQQALEGILLKLMSAWERQGPHGEMHEATGCGRGHGAHCQGHHHGNDEYGKGEGHCREHDHHHADDEASEDAAGRCCRRGRGKGRSSQ